MLRPSIEDLRRIAYGLARVLFVVAASGSLPFVWAVAHREWAPAGHFLFMSGLAMVVAISLRRFAPHPSSRHVDWGHGLVVVALAWLVVPAIGSVPLRMSGHYGRPLDAFFDAMSGVSTTGLSLIQDLDHLATSTNIWRHILQFLGGQGIVLAALLFFSTTGALAMYFGEGRDERILPNVRSTARFIWSVAVLHAVVGVSALTVHGVLALGFSFNRAFFHAVTIFMAAFDTGGFTPQSTSLAYYHSATFELITAVLMVAGALSFGIHFALWRRRPGLLRNLEVRTILISFSATLALTLVGLAVAGRFAGGMGLARQGGFQLLSAHTGTGFTTVATPELASWNGFAFVGMAVAMALGGMSGSTAGGVKSLRVGLAVQALLTSIKEALLPERAVVTTTYYQNGRHRLSPMMARSVLVVSLLYVALYLFGAAVGFAYGFPLEAALFESISAGAAVGLSVGITAPGMPIPLEFIMIGQMWLGRLEFLAVFALIGFAISWVVGE